MLTHVNELSLEARFGEDQSFGGRDVVPGERGREPAPNEHEDSRESDDQKLPEHDASLRIGRGSNPAAPSRKVLALAAVMQESGRVGSQACAQLLWTARGRLTPGRWCLANFGSASCAADSEDRRYTDRRGRARPPRAPAIPGSASTSALCRARSLEPGHPSQTYVSSRAGIGRSRLSDEWRTWTSGSASDRYRDTSRPRSDLVFSQVGLVLDGRLAYPAWKYVRLWPTGTTMTWVDVEPRC